MCKGSRQVGTASSDLAGREQEAISNHISLCTGQECLLPHFLLQCLERTSPRDLRQKMTGSVP